MTAPRGPDNPLRFNIDPEDAGRGLGRLVIALLEIVRQLLERQALRRVDAGTLTPDEIERLGQALLALEERFGELREIFGISADDIKLSDDHLDRLVVTDPPPVENGQPKATPPERKR